MYHLNLTFFQGTLSSSSRRSGTGASGSGRSTADYYQLEKPSPFHHGVVRSNASVSDRGRGGPSQPVVPSQQDYSLLLRQQEYEHRMQRHSGKEAKEFYDRVTQA